jgi:hypothetical protein
MLDKADRDAGHDHDVAAAGVARRHVVDGARPMIGAFVEELLARAEEELAGVNWRIELRPCMVTLRAIVGRQHTEFRWTVTQVTQADAGAHVWMIRDGIRRLKQRIAELPPTALDTLG